MRFCQFDEKYAGRKCYEHRTALCWENSLGLFWTEAGERKCCCRFVPSNIPISLRSLFRPRYQRFPLKVSSTSTYVFHALGCSASEVPSPKWRPRSLRTHNNRNSVFRLVRQFEVAAVAAATAKVLAFCLLPLNCARGQTRCALRFAVSRVAPGGERTSKVRRATANAAENKATSRLKIQTLNITEIAEMKPSNPSIIDLLSKIFLLLESTCIA